MDGLQQLAATLDALQSTGPERQAAEAHLNSSIDTEPSNTLLGLVSIAESSANEGQRVFALVLLRRLCFKTVEQDADKFMSKQVWDLLEDSTRGQVQATLLNCLTRCEVRRENERGVICDAVAEVEKAGMARQTSWPQLGQALAAMFQSQALAQRESCFRIYAECVSLLEAESPATAVQGLTTGLGDDSAGVRLSALAASCALLQHVDPTQLEQYAGLVVPMLQVLPPLVEHRAEQRLTTALISLIELASTPKIPSRIFKPHLAAILSFALSIIVPSSFQVSKQYSTKALDESVRQSAIELLISIAETAPAMTKQHTDFIRRLVPALMDVMAEVEEDSDWLTTEAIQPEDDDSIAVVAESSLDRLARALGDDVFEPFSQKLQPMYRSNVWQERHAALSAIAAIAEGCATSMLDELQTIVGLATRAAKDPHPRVRYAAVFAMGQLCTDLEGAVQEEYGVEVLRALVTVMNNKESRLQAFAAAGSVNFFSTNESEGLDVVMPDVFAQLLQLLERGTNWVKGNALEAMSLLARCMEERFDPFYPRIMPQLLNLLESNVDPSLESLRAKALDCTSHIGTAVNSSVFAPDAPRLLNIMHQLHVFLPEDDEETRPYLLNAFCLLAVTVGAEKFAPFIEDVLPQLLQAAAAKTEAVLGADDEEEGDGWETVEIDGETIAIKTSALEEKHGAVSNLILLTQATGSSLPTHVLQQILEVAVPLLKFYLSIEVREASAALIGVVVGSLAQQEMPQEQRSLILNTVSDAFALHVASDTDSELLSTLILSWKASCKVMPHSLSDESRQLMSKALEAQLTSLAHRDQERVHASADKDEDDLLELQELAAGESEVYYAINFALPELMGQGAPQTAIQPFLPFLQLVNSPSLAPKNFGLRFVADTIASLGDASLPLVQTHLESILHALSDEESATRRAASYAVGLAAEKAPSVYADFASAAVEPLFASIPEVNEHDSEELLARDNAVSAICKIIRHCPNVNTEELIPRWVATLPVFLDGEEMEPTNTLLLELMSRGHPSVAPTSQAAPHIVKALVSSLQSDILPGGLEQPLAQALKALLSGMPRGGSVSLPEDVKAKIQAA